MAQITISAATETSIPARKGVASEQDQPRTALIITPVSGATGDIFISWKSGETNTGAIVPSAGLALNGVEYSAQLFLYSVSGAVINYTEYPPRP